MLVIFTLYDTDDLKLGNFCNKLMKSCAIANKINSHNQFSTVQLAISNLALSFILNLED